MLPDLKVVSQSGNKFVLYLFKVFEFNLMGVPDVKGDAFGIWGIIQLDRDDCLILSCSVTDLLYNIIGSIGTGR